MDGGEREKRKTEQTKNLVRKSLRLGSRIHTIQPSSIVQPALSDGLVLGAIASPCMTRHMSELCFQPDRIDTGSKSPGTDLAAYDGDQDRCSTLSARQNPLSPATPSLDSYDFPFSDDENHESPFWAQYLNTSSSDSSSAASSSCCPSRTSSPRSPSTSDEANLLLLYLDVVCENQFPLIAKANRGWLYIAVTRTDIAYWATLSLASSYQGSSTCLETSDDDDIY